MTTFLIVIAAVIAIETLALFIVGKTANQTRKENSELKEEVAKQKRNVNALVDYEKYIVRLLKDKDKIAEEIKEAKTDEEIQNIINSLVGRNNDRVRNNAEGK